MDSTDVSLPNSDNAVIDDLKVRDYLLSPEHPVGRFKAVFFNALGYSRDDCEVLRAHLLELAHSGTAVPQPPGTYGQKFELSGTITGPAGRTATITTVWIIRAAEDFPRFVTAFPA